MTLTIEEKKYKAMRKVGFTLKEAEHLSRISTRAPYIKDLIKDRRKTLRESIAQKKTETQFLFQIAGIYKGYDWLGDDGRPDFYAMLRWYEEYGREKYPTWRTPHPKPKVSKKDQGTFDEKWEASGQKYPTGAAYPKRQPYS